MTRIQLRRDTSANWATNNPVPSAGEPCFEIDTGKLKIGDGRTKYNDLAYQGGGSSGGGAEIDDTTTSTSKVWSSSKTNTEVQAVADEVTSTQSNLTDLKTTVNGNTSDILTLKNSVAEKQPKLTAGDNITIDETTNTISATGGSTPDNMVTTDTAQTISGKKTLTDDLIISQWTTGSSTIREAHIDLSNGNEANYISADGTNKKFGLYSSSTDGIQIGTSKTDYTQGLTVTPSSLTFKDVDGTTTDLLAGGSGDIPVATSDTLGGVKIGTVEATKLSLDEDNKIQLDSSATLSNPLTNETVTTQNLYLGQYAADAYNPAIHYDKTNHVCNMLMKDRQTINGFVTYKLIDTIIKGKSLQFGDETNQYDVVTKSPDNNVYMANMAMPSNSYVDLTLGASGASYTAPADGWVSLVKTATAINQFISLSTPTISTVCIAPLANAGLGLFLPVKQNDTFYTTYDAGGTTNHFRFIYAVGAEPTA